MRMSAAASSMPCWSACWPITLVPARPLPGEEQVIAMLKQLLSHDLPLLPALLSPDRWLLWLGILFILSVYFFPTGIVGKLHTWRTR
jgi:hypothetical protein